MNAISLLFGFLSNPRQLISIGGIALIAMVYFLGPRFGLHGTPRLIVVLSLVALFIILQVVLFLRRKSQKNQAAADLETSMIMEADKSVAAAEAGQKRAREDARRELVAAIDVLKKSNLANGRGGKAALYVLPWYVVLGAGYSGKSSLIANSGLQSPGKGPGELRGIGASSNCEWWFTNHAVFLEADRRFSALAGAKAAETDWETYLTTLGKQRSQTALNGAVLTISAADLMQNSTSNLEEQARLLRQRLDTMAEKLQLVFPVYLMVTKLDLVQGCNEFFDGLAGSGTDQIFGATLRASQMRSGKTEELVGTEFERLYQNLCRRRQMRLTQPEHATVREGTFLFPLQLRSLSKNLQRFVRVLCEPNAYGRNPLLRGFYFSSAGGEGEVSDRVVHDMNRILGLPSPTFSQATPDRPLFLRGFFRKVLVPDRDIARPTRGAARRTLLVRRVAQIAALVVLSGFIVNLCVSFGRSQYLISQTEDRARSATTAVLAEHNDRVAQVDEQLAKLDPLRLQLEKLDRAGRGISQVIWMGLNRGERVNTAARELYLQRFTDVVSEPYVKELELWLLKSRPLTSEFPEYYKRYQAYRMLFAPTRGDSSLVTEVLQAILTENAVDGRISEGSLDRIRRHVVYAMSHAEEMEVHSNEKLQMERQVVANADSYISEFWTPNDYYRRVIANANDKRRDLRFNLGRLSQASTMLKLHDNLTAAMANEVPASFTRSGWDEEISKSLGNIDETLARDAWLLPQRMMDQKAILKTELLNLYADDYVQHWRRFLSAVELVKPSDMSSARALLRNLRSDEFPYQQLLDQAEYNLTLGQDGDIADAEVLNTLNRITGSFAALHAFQKNQNHGDENSPQDELIALIEAIENKLEEQDQGRAAQQNAAAFTRAVVEAGRADESIIGQFMSFASQRCYNTDIGGQQGSNQAFESVLRLPGLHAWQAFLRDTERHLDELWEDAVYSPFNSDLKAKYPFSTSAVNEVALGDFGDFFGGGGVLNEFVDAHLAPYIDQRTFAPRLIYDNGLLLTEEAVNALFKGGQIKSAFFAAGENNPHFDFTLTPEQARVSGRENLWVSRTYFAIGEQKFGFGGGSEPPKNLVWPPAEPGASIRVQLTDESTVIVTTQAGYWGLFRMMQLAESSAEGSARFRRTWKRSLSNSTGEIVVPCRLNFRKAVHPFIPGILNFDCPSQLHR